MAVDSMVVEKELAQGEQMKASGERDDDELGETTSSNSSMKSPVTPASASEHNGTPAIRWKSYTAKQQECHSHGKLGGGESKGKLVINLCGIPRSLMKLSPSSPEMHAAIGQEMDVRNSDASVSSPEHVLNHYNGRDSCSPMEDVGLKKVAGSSGAIPQCTTNSNSTASKHQSVNYLARKVCLRIRKIRRTLKSSECPKMDRSKLESSSQPGNPDGKVSHSSKPKNVQTSANDGFQNGGQETAPDVDRCASLRGSVDRDAFLAINKYKEDSHTNAAVEDHQEVTGSQDVIYSDDETSCQANRQKRAVVHDGHENSKGDGEQLHYTDVNVPEVSDDQEAPGTKDNKCISKEVPCMKDAAHARHCTARSLSHDAGAFSETSKLDMKEQTVLETLLRDEPPGYSSAGASEQSLCRKGGRSDRGEYSQKDDQAESSQRHDQAESSQIEDSESSDAESDGDDDECSQSDEYDDESGSSESHECEDDECNCHHLSPSSHSTPIQKRVAGFNEQVPSVLCDAEGNVWHIGKRAEQAKGISRPKQVFSSGALQKGRLSIAKKSYDLETQELDRTASGGLSMTPFASQIESNWKWPCDADYSIGSVGEVSNRAMVAKERSVFVGCIPDGTENLEHVLQSLMEKFLERFDFAPAILGQVQLVKVVKDFAFLELATEKIAHIVLAANQLDAFEWGVNGFHFNIEGCKGTHTSVRPLIEYMPLKPARVIFIGNIPKSRWQKEYLEVFFARILRGSDGPSDTKVVLSIYLLPDSCDAYLELASELMADAIIFKCNKNPHLLKEIGEDVFICRDSSSIPLMSKHKPRISPQRSLFVGVSAPGQEFKIDCVRKVFEEILPMIARETNQPGYLEYISVQPGKDYAFLQFNSESIVDAVMEEYVENTHLFVCSSTPLSYIILRPPAYVRPGTRYRLDSSRDVGLKLQKSLMNNRSTKHDPGTSSLNTRTWKSKLIKHPLMPRRFGDEPPKKTDIVMSIGASPLPRATWNGLPSTGACAADPDCMLVIGGLPNGFSYKLLRGALNELFEKVLCQTGLLEVGMLVLRHLDRDNNLDVVASLPSSKFVKALLSLGQNLHMAGSEIRLFPKAGQRKITWKGNPAETIRGQGEVSCLSDEEVQYGDDYSGHGRLVDMRNASRRKSGRSQFVNHAEANRKPAMKRAGLELDSDAVCEESFSPSTKKIFRGDISGPLKTMTFSRNAPTRLLQASRAMAAAGWEDGKLKAKLPHFRHRTGPLALGRRAKMDPGEEEAKSTPDDYPKEILHIISEGGRRKIQAVGPARCAVRLLGNANVSKVVRKKRKLVLRGQNLPVQMKRFKKLGQFSGVF